MMDYKKEFISFLKECTQYLDEEVWADDWENPYNYEDVFEALMKFQNMIDDKREELEGDND